jgi:hypothetical protein
MVINLIDILSIWKKSGVMDINKLIRDISESEANYSKILDESNSFFNVSLKYKIILWLWRKCGTTHMGKILSKYDFKFYRFENNSLNLVADKIALQHDCGLFQGHEKYSIISAVRNPYSRFFSEYTYRRPSEEFIYNETNKEKFKSLVYNACVYAKPFSNGCFDFTERIPDYPVRLENLYEDYSKIPFITDSEYFKSGELKKDINFKVNVSNEDDSLWRKFYTQEIADIIYYRMPRYFELFGYDK